MRRFINGLVLAFSVLWVCAAQAASPVKDGTVWVGWYVRVNEGKWDQYMDFLNKVHRLELEALKKEGYIVSYQIIKSDARMSDDWNLAIVLEYKNWAALDVPGDVLDDVEDRASKDVPGIKELQKAKNDWRKVIGYRTHQQILFK